MSSSAFARWWFISAALLLLPGPATAALPGESSAAAVLDGEHPWPRRGAEPPAPVLEGLARDRLGRVPPVGVHPRILITPEELPGLRQRLRETAMGRELRASLDRRLAAVLQREPGGPLYEALAAGAVDRARSVVAAQTRRLPELGHYQPWPMVLVGEALLALIDEDGRRGRRAAAATAAWAELIRPHLEQSLAGPHADDVWRTDPIAAEAGPALAGLGARDLTGYHLLGYAYDFAHGFMTEDERRSVRTVIARLTAGRLWMGARLPHHFRNWNWIAVGLSQPLLALAIEGEDGSDPRVYRLGVEIARDYLTYGISRLGTSTEAVGYTQFGLVWGNPFLAAAARRGDLLLAHPHHRAMLDGYLHTMEPSGRQWTSQGDGGDRGPSLETLAFWRWYFPADPRVRLLWRNARAAAGPRGLDQPLHPIEILLQSQDEPDPVDEPGEATSLGLPLTRYDSERGSLEARSDWGRDAVAVQFECRVDAVAANHDHSDHGHFTLFAHGRSWAKDNFRSVETRHHSAVLIDGAGQGYWPGPGRWLGLAEEGWALIAAIDAKAGYDWMWPKSLLNDPPDSPRFAHPRWASYAEEAREFQRRYAGVPRERDDRPSVVAHFQGYEAGDPRLWDEDGWPWRYVHNPVATAFRTLAFVREPVPYLLIVDDIRKDDAERLYEWLLQTGRETVVVSHSDRDWVLGDGATAAAARAPRLLVRVLEQGEPERERDYSSRPSARLETFERRDTLRRGPDEANPGRSFGLDQRLVIASRAVEPKFKILLVPHRSGDRLPETAWNPERTVLTVRTGSSVDTFTFERSAADGRTRVHLAREGATAVAGP